MKVYFFGEKKERKRQWKQNVLVFKQKTKAVSLLPAMEFTAVLNGKLLLVSLLANDAKSWLRSWGVEVEGPLSILMGTIYLPWR